MAKRPRKAAKQRTRKAVKVRKRPVAKKRPAKSRPAKKRQIKRTKQAAVQTLRTPPSSLDLNRTATAARSGRQSMAENQRRHPKMGAVTGGDVDVNMEDAYFTGDETPGGDNMTPDQSDVDEIGHAMGVEYGDTEELKGSDKVAERDKHRWETE